MQTLLSFCGEEGRSSESTRSQPCVEHCIASPELPGTLGWDWVKVDHSSTSLTETALRKKFFLQSLENVQPLKFYLSQYVWLPLQTFRANNHYVGSQDLSRPCLPPMLCFPTATCAWDRWAAVPGSIRASSCLPSSLLPGCAHTRGATLSSRGSCYPGSVLTCRAGRGASHRPVDSHERHSFLTKTGLMWNPHRSAWQKPICRAD